MLIRFTVQNVLSFATQKKFDMIPAPRFKRLAEHVYKIGNFEILKLAVMYGANGAGKSNFVKSLELLKKFVLHEMTLPALELNRFRLVPESVDSPQLFSIEFFHDGIPFYYAIKTDTEKVMEEELYISGFGKKADELIFERTTSSEKITSLRFNEEFEKTEEAPIWKNIYEKEIIKPNESCLKVLSGTQKDELKLITVAAQWFRDYLLIIHPDSKPQILIQKFENDSAFKNFSKKMLFSLNTGIRDMGIYKTKLDEQKSPDFYAFIKNQIEKSPTGAYEDSNLGATYMKEEEVIYSKILFFRHLEKTGFIPPLFLGEESDGTIRLLDLLPAFKELIDENKVIIIDEIERSMHPLLIKELVQKFSGDKSTNGQLIFTTHETALLDQNIFRQDEIWFAEKDKTGATDLYSLSDYYPEHSTIDIRKGYLNGRYGAIPFLANLEDLNWHINDP